MTRTLIQLGLTDRTALAEARRCAGGEAELVRLVTCGASRALGGASPVILSTCERFEVYGFAHAEETGRIKAVIDARLGLSERSIALQRRVNTAAVAHLFAVATGLDSRLVGEPHILGQVSRAPARSGASGSLARVFQDAVARGRAARVASGLDRIAVSCVDLAIARARARARPNARAGVVGSGAIARETALRLVECGFRVTVFARHTERAAQSLPPTVWVAGLDRMPQEIAAIDLLIAATSSATPVVEPHCVASRREELLLIDLGMPANIDACVRRHPAVTLITLDDLLEGQQRPTAVIDHARALTAAAAARWSRRWLGAGLGAEPLSARRTVA